MDQEACIGAFEEDVTDEDVDPTAPAMSAASYLRQMRAERKTVAEVVAIRPPPPPRDDDCTSPEAKKKKQWLESVGFRTEHKPSRETPSSLIPAEEWQRAKCREFGEFRAKIAARLETERPLKIKALSSPDEEQWHEILLEKCLPEFENVVEQYANHTGTPPAIPMVFAIPKKHLSQLIEHLVEWADEEGLTRPIREWIYALLLVIDLPLVQDVVSALRNLAKECKNHRSQLSEDRRSEAFEFSLFIAIIGIFFGQKDVSDLG
ncbi:unnamed protein product [Caenorhabditis sp. 36 PRJEB53466]|nr:unnamed protein product [Caenorhabditis sp. 36 PRJEB53466]